MDDNRADYERNYRTLQRRRRRDDDPSYRQHRASAIASLPPSQPVDFPVAWHRDDRPHPLIGVSGYRLANSYTSEVSPIRMFRAIVIVPPQISYAVSS